MHCFFRLSCLLAVATSLFGQVKLRREAGRIAVDIAGKPFTEMFFGPETRKPYLHPLRSAKGTVVTRQYPMISEEAAKAQGEATDHPHHQGLTFTYDDVNGDNFWASDSTQLNEKSGRIRLRKIVKLTSGAKRGSARLVFDWVDHSGKTILTEDRTMVFRGSDTERSIDFDIRLRAVTNVKFGDTKEGMLNLRVASGLEEPHPKLPTVPVRTGIIHGSTGCHTEKECWGKQANWMDVSGTVEGESLGIAMFDHPQNPRHPTFWHVRGYGLFAANPFGTRSFTGDAKTDGSLVLKPGQKLRFRYRVLIHPAETDLAAAYIAWTLMKP